MFAIPGLGYKKALRSKISGCSNGSASFGYSIVCVWNQLYLDSCIQPEWAMAAAGLSAFRRLPKPVPKRHFPPRKYMRGPAVKVGQPFLLLRHSLPKERKAKKRNTRQKNKRTPGKALPHVTSWRRPTSGPSLINVLWGILIPLLPLLMQSLPGMTSCQKTHSAKP